MEYAQVINHWQKLAKAINKSVGIAQPEIVEWPACPDEVRDHCWILP
ncbi:hypothetical protein [Microbulbifer spongiae]|uniref:Phage tail protein n=1 Tax=Microbulbifer spongiae TaxID=2944933 RepID=A0ABY9ECF5_9GAMM|nr:hypothetical protein [Microbulbifer sp. MI-G]WKD50709.1 hypothetical protein M8T91_04580 [Microbulbifer sp. MI-G]